MIIIIIIIDYKHNLKYDSSRSNTKERMPAADSELEGIYWPRVSLEKTDKPLHRNSMESNPRPTGIVIGPSIPIVMQNQCGSERQEEAWYPLRYDESYCMYN